MDITYYKKYEPIFGEWKIVREIGEGSFGKVFELERVDDFNGNIYKAALKAITIPQSQSEIKSVLADGMDKNSATAYFRGFVEEMVGEFVMMSQLKGNSNIVNYEDHKVFAHEDGIGWDILIRMELLTPLIDYTEGRTLTRSEIIKLGTDMCRALEACRACQIIHRDIKPENIFMSRLGDYKLGDFGIAKTVEKTTGGLSKKGTYTYMAPEVYKGEKYGASVDIYSLGIVLYRYMNNNRTPFLPDFPQIIRFTDRETALARRINGEAIPVPVNADAELAKIILKACAYNPKDRFASPTEMREALERLGEKPAVSALAAENKTEKTFSAEAVCYREENNDKTVSIFNKSKPSPSAQKSVKPAIDDLELPDADLEGDASEVSRPLAREANPNYGRVSANVQRFSALRDSVGADGRYADTQNNSNIDDDKTISLFSGNEKQSAKMRRESSRSTEAKARKDRASENSEVDSNEKQITEKRPTKPSSSQRKATTSSSNRIVAIATGFDHTVCLRKNGTVVATGANGDNQCEVNDWENIVAITAGARWTAGLKIDGTVVVVGRYSLLEVDSWRDVVAIASGDHHLVGLRKDGAVVATGINAYGLCDVSIWKDIAAIFASSSTTIGLKKDGTFVAAGKSFSGINRIRKCGTIAAMAGGYGFTAGLKPDGTVVAAGDNRFGQCNVSNWTDIVAISANKFYTVGLKKDGAVVAAGDNRYGQCDVSSWTDIVAVSAGDFHVVGLKSDGTVVATGNNEYNQCDVKNLK